MTISLEDLSPAALEAIADLIEQRLENDESYLESATWYEAQARQNAARELSQVLRDANIIWIPARNRFASRVSLALH